MAGRGRPHTMRARPSAGRVTVLFAALATNERSGRGPRADSGTCSTGSTTRPQPRSRRPAEGSRRVSPARCSQRSERRRESSRTTPPGQSGAAVASATGLTHEFGENARAADGPRERRRDPRSAGASVAGPPVAAAARLDPSCAARTSRRRRTRRGRDGTACSSCASRRARLTSSRRDTRSPCSGRRAAQQRCGRTVTVLFTDLVESTRLGSNSTPSRCAGAS